MLRILILWILGFLAIPVAYSQTFLNDKAEMTAYVGHVLHQDYDQVRMVYRDNNTKDTDSTFPQDKAISVDEQEVVLSSKQVKLLNQLLINTASYSNQLSGLTHRDIEFIYSKNGSVILKILVSSITRDISVIGTKVVLRNRISNNLEQYIIQLFHQHKLTTNREQIFTEF